MWAASRARTVTWVERDSGLLELTDELLAESGLDNVAFCQAELAGPGDHRPGGPMPLSAGSVDLVIDRPAPAARTERTFGARTAVTEYIDRVSAATAHRCAPVG